MTLVAHYSNEENDDWVLGSANWRSSLTLRTSKHKKSSFHASHRAWCSGKSGKAKRKAAQSYRRKMGRRQKSLNHAQKTKWSSRLDKAAAREKHERIDEECPIDEWTLRKRRQTEDDFNRSKYTVTVVGAGKKVVMQCNSWETLNSLLPRLEREMSISRHIMKFKDTTRQATIGRLALSKETVTPKIYLQFKNLESSWTLPVPDVLPQEAFVKMFCGAKGKHLTEIEKRIDTKFGYIGGDAEGYCSIKNAGDTKVSGNRYRKQFRKRGTDRKFTLKATIQSRLDMAIVLLEQRYRDTLVANEKRIVREKQLQIRKAQRQGQRARRRARALQKRSARELLEERRIAALPHGMTHFGSEKEAISASISYLPRLAKPPTTFGVYFKLQATRCVEVTGFSVLFSRPGRFPLTLYSHDCSFGAEASHTAHYELRGATVTDVTKICELDALELRAVEKSGYKWARSPPVELERTVVECSDPAEPVELVLKEPARINWNSHRWFGIHCAEKVIVYGYKDPIVKYDEEAEVLNPPTSHPLEVVQKCSQIGRSRMPFQRFNGRPFVGTVRWRMWP